MPDRASRRHPTGLASICVAVVATCCLVFPCIARAQAEPPLSREPEWGTRTSAEAIREAWKLGEIDEEQALVYRVWALFGDERLPERFREKDLGESHLAALQEAIDRFAELSPWAQDQILPFLRRPSDRDSWVERRLHETSPAPEKVAITWKKVPVLGGRATVWYQTRYAGDGRRAGDLARALGGTIWPALTRLAGHLPGSDAAIPENRPGPDPDPGLDVYLVHGLADRAVAMCFRRAGFVEIDSEDSIGLGAARQRRELRGTLTHELWHTLQCAGGWLGNGNDPSVWLSEATANWSVDYVYPTANTEHPYVQPFLDSPEKSLRTVDSSNRQYGAYLWFQYLVRRLNRPSLVPELHRQIAGGAQFQFRSAVESVTGLPWGTLWPQFSVALLNRPALAQFRQWDALAAGARLDTISVPGEIALTLPSLSARYLNVELDRANQDLRFIFPAANGINVQVARRSGGVYTSAEDWTGGGRKTLCGNPVPQTGSPADSAVVIVSNSSGAAWSGKLRIERMSCDFSYVNLWQYPGLAPDGNRYPGLIVTGTRTQSGVNPCTQQSEVRSSSDYTNVSGMSPVRYDGKWYDYTCNCDYLDEHGAWHRSRSTVANGHHTYTLTVTSQPWTPPWPNFRAGTSEYSFAIEGDSAGHRSGSFARTSSAAGPVFSECDAIGPFTWEFRHTGSDVVPYGEVLWGSVSEDYLKRHLTRECSLPPPGHCEVSFPR